MRSQIQFPIVDAPEEIEEVVSEEEGILPGFEMLSGLGALALASAGRRTKSIDD